MNQYEFMVSTTAEAIVHVRANSVEEAEDRYREWELSQDDTDYAFKDEDTYYDEPWTLDYMSTEVWENVK